MGNVVLGTFLVGVVARQWKKSPSAVSFPWHSVQRAGYCWVPQQRGRQCLRTGQNQSVSFYLSVCTHIQYIHKHTVYPPVYTHLVFFPHISSQSTCEQCERGSVWSFKYLCVLEASSSNHCIPHSHPGPQRYQYQPVYVIYYLYTYPHQESSMYPYTGYS